MKVFIVDIKKCLDLSHYETFFYENIRDDKLALFNRELSSIEELDKVYDWIQEEINRSPFSITKGLVVFYIPRNLTGDIALRDINLIVNTYIYHKVARKLDNRFRFACFYLDRTDSYRDITQTYRIIEEESADYCTECAAYLSGKFPARMKNEELDFDSIGAYIDDIRVGTLRDYYRGILSEVKEASKGQTYAKKANAAAFLTHCIEKIKRIDSIRVPHFGNDIAEKTEGLLKLVSDVCEMAKNGTDSEFNNIVDNFMDQKNFDSKPVDLEEKKRVIATYRTRLNNWLIENPTFVEEEKEVRRLEYVPSEFADEYTLEIDEKAVKMTMKKALNPSFRELVDFDLTDRVFRNLDETVAKASEKLKEFGEKVIDHMREFCKKNKDFITEPPVNPAYSESELEKTAAAQKELNHYSPNYLPGYSEEIRLRQELDGINNQIKNIGEKVRRYTFRLFLGTFLFAILSVAVFYIASQYTVFMKEDTWWVFGLYILITGGLFLSGYLGIKHKYMKEARELLQKALKMIEEFLKNYKNRAKEFEDNVNNAMRYACLTEQQNRVTGQRSENALLTGKYMWHKQKIRSILNNLDFFVSFVGDTAPVKEKLVPKLDPYEDNAENSELYQMKIFS